MTDSEYEQTMQIIEHLMAIDPDPNTSLARVLIMLTDEVEKHEAGLFDKEKEK